MRSHFLCYFFCICASTLCVRLILCLESNTRARVCWTQCDWLWKVKVFTMYIVFSVVDLFFKFIFISMMRCGYYIILMRAFVIDRTYFFLETLMWKAVAKAKYTCNNCLSSGFVLLYTILTIFLHRLPKRILLSNDWVIKTASDVCIFLTYNTMIWFSLSTGEREMSFMFICIFYTNNNRFLTNNKHIFFLINIEVWLWH